MAGIRKYSLFFVLLLAAGIFLVGCASSTSPPAQPPAKPAENQPAPTFACPTGEIVTDLSKCPAQAQNNTQPQNNTTPQSNASVNQSPAPAPPAPNPNEPINNGRCRNEGERCGIQTKANGDDVPSCCGPLVCSSGSYRYCVKPRNCTTNSTGATGCISSANTWSTNEQCGYHANTPLVHYTCDSQGFVMPNSIG